MAKTIKKVSKKVSKKVTLTPEQEAELQQKKEIEEMKAHNKKVDTIGKAIVALAEKHGVKLMVQGYDESYEVGFILAGNIKTDFEARAMESLMKTYTRRN